MCTQYNPVRKEAFYLNFTNAETEAERDSGHTAGKWQGWILTTEGFNLTSCYENWEL